MPRSQEHHDAEQTIPDLARSPKHPHNTAREHTGLPAPCLDGVRLNSTGPTRRTPANLEPGNLLTPPPNDSTPALNVCHDQVLPPEQQKPQDPHSTSAHPARVLPGPEPQPHQFEFLTGSSHPTSATNPINPPRQQC
jgi:hypothetical protein